MNAVEVENLGRYLQTTVVADIRTIEHSLGRHISNLTWKGPDADQFRQIVWPSAQSSFQAASFGFHEFGGLAMKNAEEQRRASDDQMSPGDILQKVGDSIAATIALYGTVTAFSERFADNVLGPQDITLARLQSGDLPDGWSRLDDQQIKDAGLDPASFNSSSGLNSKLFRNKDGSVVLSFDGTDLGQSSDVHDDLSQYAGFGARQYSEAIELAKKLKDRYGDDLVITGYSLGGGLASVAAVATNTHAVTFNAAAVNDNTLRQAGLDPAQARSLAGSLVHSISVNGQALDVVQAPGEMAGGPKVMGDRYGVGSPTLDHGMNVVLADMKADSRFW